MGSSHGQQTIEGACVSEIAVHDHGRRLNQREFRPMAEVPFCPVRQLSEYKGKGASASRELDNVIRYLNIWGRFVLVRKRYIILRSVLHLKTSLKTQKE